MISPAQERATPASAMRITVRTFARYAEVVGERIALELTPPATVGDVIAALRAAPGGARLPAALLVAVDHRMADVDTPVTDASIVALLPPLAGG